MSKRFGPAVAAALGGALVALTPAVVSAQIGGGAGTSKDKVIANPGGGCERDYAARPGDTAGIGGCDDVLGDGTRGVKRRPPAQPSQPSPSSQDKPEQKTQKKKSTD